MWFITVFETYEINELGWSEYGCQRCWGYFHDYETACRALRENWTDMWETIYDYAVLEKIPEGLVPDVEEVHWFKFNMEYKGYFEMPIPEGESKYDSFTIG